MVTKGCLIYNKPSQLFEYSTSYQSLLNFIPANNPTKIDYTLDAIKSGELEKYNEWFKKVVNNVDTDDIVLQANNLSFINFSSFKMNVNSENVFVTISLRDNTSAFNHSSKFVEYKAMIDEVTDYAIFFLNESGCIMSWNAGAKKIKGYNSDEVIGKKISIFYTEEDRNNGLPQMLIEQAINNKRTAHEGWRIRKDGSKFWGSVILTSIHNDTGNLIGFTKVTRDLTERKSAEDNLVKQAELIRNQNEKLNKVNSELQSFAYNASHDLKEPLRKIKIFSDKIINEELNLSESAVTYFQRIQAGTDRMRKLIDDMLEYAQTNSQHEVEQIDSDELQEWLSNEWKDHIGALNATIHWNGKVKFDGVAFQIKQLILNLVSNSLKFTKPDVPSLIDISLSYSTGFENGNVSAKPDVKYVYIKLTDNGIGFDPEHNKIIFELLQRLHGRSAYEGSGIGLAICKKIVQLHNGNIYAEGKPDQGATFRIFLPVLQESIH